MRDAVQKTPFLCESALYAAHVFKLILQDCCSTFTYMQKDEC